MEYISVSALISHLPNLGIFGEQLTKHPAIGPVFPGEGDGGALPNLESSTGGKRDMIRVRNPLIGRQRLLEIAALLGLSRRLKVRRRAQCNISLPYLYVHPTMSV